MNLKLSMDAQRALTMEAIREKRSAADQAGILVEHALAQRGLLRQTERVRASKVAGHLELRHQVSPRRCVALVFVMGDRELEFPMDVVAARNVAAALLEAAAELEHALARANEENSTSEHRAAGTHPVATDAADPRN